MFMEVHDFISGLAGLLQDETNPVTALANAAAYLYDEMEGLNWAGFYLLHGDVLTLGPFQGKPACTRIPCGRGVCGSAVSENATQCVPDVHAFPGHIACDGASNAELVVPLRTPAGKAFGVLDLDSPIKGRFDVRDAERMERAARVIETALCGMAETVRFFELGGTEK